jgi:predicted aldo/keto reductase-like oxidoreductase
MEKRKCGDSDLELSVLGLGCWAFGGGKYWGYSDQEAINKMVKSAVDLGINYFDTAEAYNEGNSERSLGEAIQGIPRDKLIIGTKISPSNTNPQVLVEHCEASLKRIKTDYIDLYMVHWPITLKAIAHFTDQKVECPSINDAFATLRRLKEQGKIRWSFRNECGQPQDVVAAYFMVVSPRAQGGTSMEDTQLYAMLLGIKFPWRVNKVQVDMVLTRIDIWVEEAPGTKLPCAVCKQEMSV